MPDKQHVAILGGGVGSIVAAFELTSTPELRDRYAVTVYQSGWRLGGKGASGRSVKPDYGSRIEEHGLHVWFGFYENAFRVMREAYTELGRRSPSPLADWKEAFKPCDQIVLYEEHEDRWLGRPFSAPRNLWTPGEPGDAPSPQFPHFWQIADELLGDLLGRWRDLKARKPALAAMAGERSSWLPFGIDRLPREIAGGLLELARGEGDARLAIAHQLARRRAEKGIGGVGEGLCRSLLWHVLDDFKRWLWESVVQPLLGDDDLRLFFTTLDVASAVLQGIIEDGLIERGFEAVNDEDLREWLARHGAQPITLEQGTLVRGLYDMAFAYERGDIRRAKMAAGTALHDSLRLFFTYRGAFAWKMQAGMGDTVFGPFYEVLHKRGVRFKFFHWVNALRLSADRRYVDEIEVIPQVGLRRGLSEYEPLVEVGEPALPCWPSKPSWEQLQGGKGLRSHNFELEPNPEGNSPLIVRRRGAPPRANAGAGDEEFDIAVLGISVGALPAICGELIEDRSNPRFAAMIESSRTVMTQSFQLWLNRPLRGLGWRFADNSAACSFVEPLDTYANMSQLLLREQWPPAADVKDIAYFCGVLEDVDKETQAQANARARQSAITCLEDSVKWVWPKSVGAAGFDWSALVDPAGKSGQARFDSQYWVANLQPSERYVLTPPGSVRHRLRADESGYENLFLAGDWTKTGLDAGCVEAAAMSGMQASRAICGSPRVVVGEDDRWLAGPGRSTQPPKAEPLPAYVDYGGLASCPSPVNCTDATIYGFFLAADWSALADLCKRVFATGTGGQFDVRPLAPLVMLTFGKVPKIEPQLDPWARMGYAKEQQVALWVPVLTIGEDGALEIGWFVPSLWVDNPLSLVGGREIYGFNKMWGSITIPEQGLPGTLALEAYGGSFQPSQPAGLCPLITVEADGTQQLRAQQPRWNDLAGVVADARRALTETRAREEAALEVRFAGAGPGAEEPALPNEAWQAILRQGGAPQFYLRQFRAVNDGLRSCNQQVTKSGTTLKRVTGQLVGGRCTVTVQHLDSHPVCQELGLAAQQRALGAYEMNMDFVLEDGSPLWEG